MAKVISRGVEFEPIDRLEEKVKLLVAMVDRLKADPVRAAEESLRLSRAPTRCVREWRRETRLAAELTTLRDERDTIRTRVSDMLVQLEARSASGSVVEKQMGD